MTSGTLPKPFLRLYLNTKCFNVVCSIRTPCKIWKVKLWKKNFFYLNDNLIVSMNKSKQYTEVCTRNFWCFTFFFFITQVKSTPGMDFKMSRRESTSFKIAQSAKRAITPNYCHTYRSCQAVFWLATKKTTPQIIHLDLIPSVVQSHGHRTNERFNSCCGLIVWGAKTSPYILVV